MSAWALLSAWALGAGITGLLYDTDKSRRGSWFAMSCVNALVLCWWWVQCQK